MEKHIIYLRDYIKNYYQLIENQFLKDNLINKKFSLISKNNNGNNDIATKNIFKNSFFFIDEKKFEYSILNNIPLLIEKIIKKESEEMNFQYFKNFSIERFFNNFYLEFAKQTGDLSHIFLIILYEILDIICDKIRKDNKSYLGKLNFQIRNNHHRIKECFLNLIKEYEIELEYKPVT